MNTCVLEVRRRSSGPETDVAHLKMDDTLLNTKSYTEFVLTG